MKFYISLFLLVCAVAAPPLAQQAQDKPPQFDVEKYQFGLLKRGPKWTPESTPETQKLQEGHMANINKMARMGKLMAAGPIGGNGVLRGIFIFKAASLEDAQTLAAADPALQAGRLMIDIVDWYGPKGIGVKVQEELKSGVEPKYTMTEYFLVLLRQGTNASAANTPENQKLQLAHLWYIRRQLDAKAFVAAGPFGGKSDLLGNLIIAATSPEEAKALADADPKVKAGQLAVEIHPWWSAKEVWP